jgi:hypothetical protein
LGKPEGKRTFGRFMHIWKDMKMDIQVVGWGSIDWIGLAKNRDWWRALENVVMNFRIP